MIAIAILDPILHHTPTTNIQGKSERGKGGGRGNDDAGRLNNDYWAWHWNIQAEEGRGEGERKANVTVLENLN
jgi:hypothetical protein